MFYSQGRTERQPFKPMGCWKNGQLPSLEGNASQLDGHYTQRTDAIYKCYKATRERDGTCLQLQMEANVGVLRMLQIFTMRRVCRVAFVSTFKTAKEIQATAMCILQLVSDKLKTLLDN